jgi:hypothetical protein
VLNGKRGVDRVGLSHIESVKDRLHVGCLGKGDGASRPITSDFHSQVVSEFAKVLHGELLLELFFKSLDLGQVVSNKNQVVHVGKNNGRGGGATDEEAGVRGGRREAKGEKSASKLGVPLPGRLFQSVDWTLEQPDRVGSGWTGEAFGEFHEDLLMELTLEEGIVDVHGVDLHVATSSKVEKDAEGRELGSRGKSLEEVDAVLLSEPLCTVAGFKDWWLPGELLDPKDPLSFHYIRAGGARNLGVGASASEPCKLQRDGC